MADLEAVRAVAVAAFETAVDAVRPGRLLPRAVQMVAGRPVVRGRPLPEVRGRRVLVAAGKAAPGLAAAWLRVAPGWAETVFVLVPHEVPLPRALETAATVRWGAHPVPDRAGEAACQELLDLADGLGPDDLLVLLLSGGASALLAAPEPPLTLDEVVDTTRALLRAGAPIGALNTVRREILRAGGGGLARTAFPAPVVTLVLSDVPGDPLHDIASGPTVPSPTTAADALSVLERFGVADEVPGAVPALLRCLANRDRGGEEPWVLRGRTEVIGNNRTATEAAAGALARSGWTVHRPARFLTGEASVRGRQLGALAGALEPLRPFALVLGGETTVTVRGDGRGGRNQELALAAAMELDGRDGRVLLTGGTDGVDGVSDAAGAVVDGGSVARMIAAGIDPADALRRNDSATALAASGDAVVTGPTGTNVCDALLLVAEP